MNAENEIGPALIEDFGAILVAAIILLEPQRHRLDARAGRAVAQQHMIRHNVEDVCHGRSLLRVGRDRGDRCADTQRRANRCDKLGAVERIEMQRLDVGIDQRAA